MIHPLKTLLTGALAVLAVSCATPETETPTVANHANAPAEAVETATIAAEKNTDKGVKLRGYIDVPPQYKSVVSPYFEGFIKTVHVVIGQRVTKGSALFTLENPDYIKIQEEYLSVKQEFEYLKLDYDRQKQLAEEDITSAKQFKRVEADFIQVKTKYAALKLKLKLMKLPLKAIEAGEMLAQLTVRAPITGDITELNLTQGAFIGTEQVAAEIINTDHLHLELQAYEKDVMRIKVGQGFTFRMVDNPDQSYRARIYAVGKKMDTQSRTVQVHGHVLDTHKQFMPGMYVDAMMDTQAMD